MFPSQIKVVTGRYDSLKTLKILKNFMPGYINSNLTKQKKIKKISALAIIEFLIFFFVPREYHMKSKKYRHLTYDEEGNKVLFFHN